MANSFTTYSPIYGKELNTYQYFDSDQISKILETSHNAQLALSNDFTLAQRKDLMIKVKELLEIHKGSFSEAITKEMGKTLAESRSEIEKCILACDYYIQNIDNILKPEEVIFEDGKALITYEPIGTIFAVMPWNFPFWQLLRHAIPQLLLGNTIVFKHSSQVPECAYLIEKLFIDAGFEDGSCSRLLIHSSQVEEVISSNYIQAVTLTGSEGAGRSVASLSGKYLKKCVMELGGSDPLIIFEDADIDLAVKSATKSRLRNAGQACTAAKRFIIQERVYEEFLHKLEHEFKKIKTGDPLDSSTDIGPLSSKTAVEDIQDLVNDAKEKGAKVICGGNSIGKSNYYEPTIIEGITKDMKIYSEEAFGPVAIVYKFATLDDALEIANDSKYGLSSSVWTNNENTAIQVAERLGTGNVYINTISSSRPELPFGGVKASGFGRELGEYGVKEFANIKSIFIKK